MDYALTKKSLSVCETVFEGSAEQPVDLDLSLPDYCPDIQRILKCRINPKIFSRNISGDRLDVEGNAEVKILYLDAVKKSVRCCEHSTPFSVSFNMKTSPQNAVVKTHIKPEYLNCRALSPRRLDIHGAFSVFAQVICKSEKEFPTDIEGDDVEVKRETVTVSSLAGLAQQQFTVSDEIVLGSGKPNIEAILRSDITSFVSECKAITNKLMIKGDLNLKVLYLSDISTGETQLVDYSVPFSEILDVDGVDENCKCDLSVDMLSYDVRGKGDMSDSNPSIEFEVKLAATTAAFCDEELEVISDAYSTVYDLDLVFNQNILSNMVNQIDEGYIAKETVDISQSISNIIDLWNEQCTMNIVCEDNNMTAKGKVNVCILARDTEDVPFYAERVVDFVYPLGQEIKNAKMMAKALVASISYRLNGANNLDLRIELRINASIFENKTVRFLTEATADEEHLRKRDTKAALTLYYAGKGESLWNIAREYSVSCSAIMTENDLSDDKLLQGRMLFIPNI